MSPRRVVVEADGGSRGNPGPAGYGALVRDADSGELLREVAAGIGVASNNVAEYRGLIAGLTAALELEADDVEVRMDSLLVVNQMSGVWQVKHPAMKPLAAQAATLVRQLPSVRFRHVPRARNAHADRLANEAMDAAAAGRVWGPADAAPAPPLAPAPAAVPAAGSGWTEPAAGTVRLLLLRHGETALSGERRFSGRGDPPLTARGVAQAAAAAQRLSAYRIDAVVTSPLQRARATAQQVADATGAPLAVDDDLVDVDFGAWEGLTLPEIQQRWPREVAAWRADPAVAPPGGEPLQAVLDRVVRVRGRLTTRHAGATVVVVAHVTPIKALLRDALEAPVSTLFRLLLDPASLSVMDVAAAGPATVRLVNDTSHLGPLATGR